MWHADPEILRWTGVEPGQSEERTLEWIRFASDAAARGIAWHFVIEVDGSVAGSCDVRLPDRSDPRIGEIGYLVAAPFRRRGVGFVALSLLIDWSFGEPLRLERVQALVHPDNAASLALVARLGFTREGLLRAFRAEPGGREDREMWSVLAIDWRAS